MYTFFVVNRITQKKLTEFVCKAYIPFHVPVRAKRSSQTRESFILSLELSRKLPRQMGASIYEEKAPAAKRNGRTQFHSQPFTEEKDPVTFFS